MSLLLARFDDVPYPHQKEPLDSMLQDTPLQAASSESGATVFLSSPSSKRSVCEGGGNEAHLRGLLAGLRRINNKDLPPHGEVAAK